MAKRDDWEVVGPPLGEGGQSSVFLVRAPARRAVREACVDRLAKMSGGSRYDSKGAAEMAGAVWNYSRPDLPSELGALKLFKIAQEGSVLPPPPGSKDFVAIERLRNEITALTMGLDGLPKLLDSNVEERWIVTEYFPERTLEHHPARYRGKAVPALKAFRSLVKTVATLHGYGYVHRDIKPANVFIRADDDLVLGDFGIVFVPNAPARVTLTGERVGPRDYMPPWANLGERPDNVQPRDDVYMLGKLLWSMLDGRAMLPREYHRHPDYDFDLGKTFPGDPDMHLINSVLDACIVEQSDRCLHAAQDLLIAVETVLGIIERDGQLLKEGVPRPCRVCGRGYYHAAVLPRGTAGQPLVGLSMAGMPISLEIFICDTCGHAEFFKPTN